MAEKSEDSLSGTHWKNSCEVLWDLREPTWGGGHLQNKLQILHSITESRSLKLKV